MTIVGIYNPDGSVAQEATTCILTGQEATETNSIRERVSGTPYFYRVLGIPYGAVTDELRIEFYRKVKDALVIAPAKAVETPEAAELRRIAAQMTSKPAPPPEAAEPRKRPSAEEGN